MKKYLFLFLFFSFSAQAGVWAYFSPTPKKECEYNIIKQINKSKESIDIAIYAINNRQIVEALKKAYEKGIKIRILTDRTQAENKYSKVKELKKSGINIRVNSKHKIEHNKFAIFDKKIITTGSFSWTGAASTKNSENCLFFNRNKKTVQKYISRFNYLWKVNTKKKSEEWFAKKSSPSKK